MKTIWSLPHVQLVHFSEIEDKRPALLVTSAPAWAAVREFLRGLNIAGRIEVSGATTRHWDSLVTASDGQRAACVYAVGGGLAADAGKYISARLGLPLAVLPTALSVDAFLTPASGVRRGGCVDYIETKAPETLLLDLDVIASAPAAIRAAGITDVLSIATGCWDWKFAHERGQNPPGMEFIPWVYGAAQSILEGALDCAAAAGRGEKEGLKTLFDCLALEVQLCSQIGHSRPEEGSEHYFAYCAENFTGPGLPHGDLVGPGIFIMARLQGQDTARYESALKACGVPLDKLPAETVDKTLQSLPAYCRKHGLAFGLAHTLKT